ESPAEYSRRQFAHMEAALGKHAQEACAVIVEPLVQCAGGMRMYDPVYLTLLREACDRHEVHLIADEIAVGFGRTGTMFACERAGALADHPHVAEVRQRGMILAIELAADKASRAPYPWQERRGLRVYRHALTRGVLLRPIGNVVYFMPPYVITPAEIDLMVEV